MTEERQMQKDSARCLYNEQVECEERTRVCKKCGWNPDVNEKRKKTEETKNESKNGI